MFDSGLDSLYVPQFMSSNWNKIRVGIRIRIRIRIRMTVRVSFLYPENYQIVLKLWRHEMNSCRNSDSRFLSRKALFIEIWICCEYLIWVLEHWFRFAPSYRQVCVFVWLIVIIITSCSFWRLPHHSGIDCDILLDRCMNKRGRMEVRVRRPVTAE